MGSEKISLTLSEKDLNLYNLNLGMRHTSLFQNWKDCLNKFLMEKQVYNGAIRLRFYKYLLNFLPEELRKDTRHDAMKKVVSVIPVLSNKGKSVKDLWLDFSSSDSE